MERSLAISPLVMLGLFLVVDVGGSPTVYDCVSFATLQYGLVTHHTDSQELPRLSNTKG